MESQKFIPDHKQIILQGYCTNAPKSELEVNTLLAKLVETVRMKVVAGPISAVITEPGNEGPTGVVALATSHAAIHIWDDTEPAFFQFDLYSCKDFSEQEVIEFFNKEIGLIEHKSIMIDRNNFDFKYNDTKEQLKTKNKNL